MPQPRQHRQTVRHSKPPKLATERSGLNDRVANIIATTVGSMWMFYASIIGFAVWMAGLGVTVAGDHYPFNLMLLAVGGIMQWLAMIAILVAQNAQGNVQDKQVEHLHQLGREHRADRSNPRPLHQERCRVAGPRPAFAVSRHWSRGVDARQHPPKRRLVAPTRPRAKLAR
jgi:uncharacterized membrane protein